MTYARGGLAQGQQAQNLVSDMQEVTSIPGGTEMLMSAVAKQMGGNSGGKTKQVRLYNMGGPVEYNNGGLAAAQEVQGMGRGNDDILLHVSPEEYEALTGMWGEPDVNPNTGMPEYGFLSKLWKKVKGVVKKIVKSPLFSMIAPMALNVFAPGAGAALGKALGFAGKTAGIVGNTALRSGIGALGGGAKGALSGAVSGLSGPGGIAGGVGSKLGLTGKAAELAGQAAIGGVGGMVGGGGFGQGALGNVMSRMAMAPMEEAGEGALRSIFGKPGQTSGIGDMTGTGSMTESPMNLPSPGTPVTAPQPGILSRAGDWIKENPLLAAAGVGMLGSMGGGSRSGDAPPQLPSEFTEGIPEYDFARPQQSLPDPGNYYTYGQTGSAQPGEHQFFSDNTIGQPSGAPLVGRDLSPTGSYIESMNPTGGGVFSGLINQLKEQNQAGTSSGMPQVGAGGGALAEMLRQLQMQSGQQFAYGGYARGAGSGRDDTIEAMLSDGEYVMDAETVSLLGDGSNEHGAERLDEMREELRRHKGKNLSKGKFSANAKRPMKYLKKGGKVKKRKARGGKVKNRMLARHMRTVAKGET